MKMTSELEAMFEIPEQHTPKVLLGGGTDEKNIKRVWDGMMDPAVFKDMDNNASKKGLPVSPIMILLVQGTDGHVHGILNLPLQKFQSEVRIEPTVEASKDLRRITDWCAGFMETFCMNDSITALDLITNQIALGDKNAPFTIEAMIKEVRPKKDVRGTGGLDIGKADDILGQLSKPEIEKMKRPKTEREAFEGSLKDLLASEGEKTVSKEPEVNLVDEAHKRMKSQQQEVVDKYGYQALKDLCEKMNKPILIEKPHA